MGSDPYPTGEIPDGAVFHYYQGYTALETAEILGKNPSTIRTWLVQARWKLKEILEVEEYGRG